MFTWVKNRLSIPIFILSIGTTTLGFSIYQAQIIQMNSTTRQAAFEMLKTLNHLQYLIDSESYGRDNKDRYLEAWSDVLLVNDLCIFSSIQVQKNSKYLFNLWEKNFQHLRDEKTNKKISKAISSIRENIKHSVLHL